MVVVAYSVFMFHHLSVKFVDQFVNRCIQIMVGALGKHIVTFDVDIALSLLAAFFFSLVLDTQ